MMNHYYNMEIIDEIIDTVSAEYGKEVQRIAKINDVGGVFHMTFIFTDYCILEAKIKVCDFCDIPSIRIQGNYF